MTRQRVEIIAEIGSNWRGSATESLPEGYQRAERLIELAGEAGADMAKFQLFDRTLYKAGTKGHRLLAANELPRHWLPWLKGMCERYGLEFVCTPFDLEAVNLLTPLVRRWKISSYELGHRALLEAVAQTMKPLLLSTGMATVDAIRAALQIVAAARPRGRVRLPGDITLLHCVSAYPAQPSQMNLTALPIPELTPAVYGQRVATGLSDHTLGASSIAAIMAVARGVEVIEKHVTEDHALSGPDHHFAADPAEFRAYVAQVRLAERMLGDGRKRPMPGEDVKARWNDRLGRRGP